MLFAIIVTSVAFVAVAGSGLKSCFEPFGLGAEEIPECLQKRLQAE